MNIFSNICVEAEVDLVNAWMSGLADGISRNALGYPESGSSWFVINSAWFRNWQNLTGMTDDLRSFIKPIDNSELLCHLDSWDSELPILRPDATEMKAFVLVPAKAWEFFARNYGYLRGSCIHRFSYETKPGHTEVETHLKQLKVGAISEFQAMKQPKYCFFSRANSVSHVCNHLARLGNLSYKALRLWILDQSYEVLESKLAEAQTSNSADSIRFPGKLVACDQLVLGLDSDATYILELSETTWTFQLDSPLCGVCRTEATSTQCRCGLTACCSDACSRLASCCSEEQKAELDVNEPTNYDDNDEITNTLTKSFGLVGLRNLGATCYMNAGLQCLSHTRFLTEYFLEDRYVTDKNLGNPLGFGGLLAEEYASLLKQMWYSSTRSVSPSQFKRCLGEYASQFQGHQQHDCHEFLLFLLDGLHEDLNRIVKKPYIESSQDLGEDETAAALAWKAHLERNSSVVVDLMHGQLHSKVMCLTCQSVSNTFDPFMMLSLPIPSQKGTDVKIVYLGLEDEEPKVLHMSLDADKTVGNVLRFVESELHLNEARMEGVVLYEGSFNSFIERSCEAPECLWVYQMNLDSFHVIVESIQNSRPASYPRIVPIRRGATFLELQEQVYLNFRKTLGFEVPFSEAIETELLYQLKLFASSSDNNDVVLCSICQSNDCSSCSVPLTSDSADILFSSDSILRLLAVWPDSADLSGLGQIPSMLLSEEKPVTLLQCLTQFTEPETLDGAESVYCRNCGEHRKATKTLSIYRLPQVLIIHLKRFSQESQSTKKNCSIVDFPLSQLDLSEFVKGNSSDEAMYDLYGIVNHYGELSGGHYTADAKQEGAWHTFDDSTVSEGFGGVTSAGYLLFYQRLN
mmetsp:Transcript_10643/g.20606  ORF Transcript_10643/g.20606 Transcript_10643/m.20606 type:complete len:859 (+) Transcript_10643:13-2589(+)